MLLWTADYTMETFHVLNLWSVSFLVQISVWRQSLCMNNSNSDQTMSVYVTKENYQDHAHFAVSFDTFAIEMKCNKSKSLFVKLKTYRPLNYIRYLYFPNK
jgi:hypothetical protein